MRDILREGLESCNIAYDENMIDKFLIYFDMLVEWNEKMNLTAITEKKEIAKKHFLDSVTLLRVLDIKNGAKVIDVGTGAGFPGLPLKIVRPDIEITLLDSLAKRVNFLQNCVNEMGIFGAECIHSRAEDAARDEKYREVYDLAVSRAVANMASLSEYMIPFVKVGGIIAAYKGPSPTEEADGAKNAVGTLGGGNIRIEQPYGEAEELAHSIILIDKIKPTAPKYPRLGNKAIQKPL